MDTPPVRSFSLDAGSTSVSFSVRWFGVLQVRGEFTGVTGVVRVPGPSGLEVSVSVQVEGASVRTGIARRDRHLRGMRFLDSGHHPFIRFSASDVCRQNGTWEVHGMLSLRGRDREITVSVPDESTPGGQHRLRAHFTIPRGEHEIGAAHGIRRLNPLLWAIAPDVSINVEMLVPATLLQPAAASALSR